jgi:DUF1009 family protein
MVRGDERTPANAREPKRRGAMAKTTPFSVDDRVTSPTFGEGTVRAVDEKDTTIVFDQNGTRKFLSSVVKLERSDSLPPPPKPERARKAR